MRNRLLRFLLIAGITLFTALMVWPYHDGALRYGHPLALVTLWGASLILAWRKRWRWLLVTLPVVAAIPFCLRGKTYQTEDLRESYVDAMLRMEGTPYLWGGESRKGIDCSGLPRKALRQALLKEGWQRANGNAFREWARQWWYDSSAKALGSGYRGFTKPLGITGVLREVEPAGLLPGDLAITRDGRHVMVYVGHAEWIQADPGFWKVSRGKPATHPNPWYDAEVSLHRWTILQ
jgi:hypothetical protein